MTPAGLLESFHHKLHVPLLVCAVTSVRAPSTPCATLSMLTYYRTSRSLHFPFGAVCSLSGSQPEIWSVSWKRRVHRIACRLFVFSLISTFRRSSQAEGEGAPGSSGPAHLGHRRPKVVAKTLMFGHNVFVRMRCLTDDLSSDTLSTSCTHSRQLRESCGLRRRDVVAVLAGYKDGLSEELIFSTTHRGVDFHHRRRK